LSAIAIYHRYDFSHLSLSMPISVVIVFFSCSANKA
jgi:hypothetical protein